MTTAEILTQVAAGKITPEQAASLIGTAGQKPLTCKVSEKGAISVYGLQRMPVTLYVGQWERLAEFIPQLHEFAKANADKLSRK